MSSNIILVPLDGSELSERALAVADSLLNQKSDGQMIILRALETPSLSAWLPAETLPLHLSERQVVEDYLAQKEKDWSDRGYEVSTALYDGPAPFDAINAECSAKDPNLVVMASHGRSGWLRLLGSTTEKVLSFCPTQIYVVRGTPRAASNILVPLDGSQRAEKALPQALDFAKGGRAKINLVGVSVVFQGHAFENDLKNLVEPDLAKIEAYLDEQAEWLRNQGLEVDVIVRRGQAAEQILEVAEEENNDLILMTSSGRSGLAKWLYGSVAERIIRYSKCSTLVLKDLESKEKSK